MSVATKNRISDVIREMGYRPNVVAQSLKSGYTKTIGVIIPDLMNLFYPEFVKGIGRSCKGAGYSIVLCDSNEEPEEEARHIISLRARQVDGLIICSSGDNASLYKELQEQNYPVVFCDRAIESVQADMVLIDDFRAAYIATEHLIRLGNTDIGLIIPPIRSLSTRSERLAGYRQAFRNHNLPVNEKLICFSEQGNTSDLTRNIGDFIRKNRELTAMFATNAVLGFHLLEAIRAESLRIPEDIAVVVFDEVPWASLLDPPVTTLVRPADKQGGVAADMLIRKLNAKGRQSERPTKVLLDASLNIRESCGFKWKNGYPKTL
jgi:LacI family kdg operon repressor